jgi:glycosyltransferase involved in cell wall biosynthesis
MLSEFRTAYYYREPSLTASLGRKLIPGPFARVEKRLRRRHLDEIPADRVRSSLFVDLAHLVENRAGGPSRRRAARWRTRAFDRALGQSVRRQRPDALLVFSDVGSEEAIPACRELGIAAVLSVVHGDVFEEQAVLAREQERAPEFFPIYLGDGAVDRDEMDWLHARRLREQFEADVLLVPSAHLARKLEERGIGRERIEVIPYAADTERFRPEKNKRHGESCTFLFAGGITQRKGIKDLLDAWDMVKRPGWRLQLLGALPRDCGVLSGRLDGVECLGRVGHAEVPGRMASADVFVFPSLFEGSAVVTYEALACGLPTVTTAEAGSVARDGLEGFLVPSANAEALAEGMERLGTDAELRALMGRSARARALEFHWTRYQDSIERVIRRLSRGADDGRRGNLSRLP